MAQELHDAVGHGLSVIAMQAGAGRHVLDHDPDRARQALQAVEETARSSPDALRREIAALGAGGSRVLEPSEAVAAPRGVTGARDSVRLRPQEGVADLPLLVERVRDGGLLVELDLDAALDREVLPAEVDHAAYRIVQESLTNVLRHAGTGVTAQVRIRAVTAELLVEVSNTDAGEPDDSAQIPVPGNGLQGMQIRARRVGGRVEVAPHARGGSRGGFCVTARLPLPALARTERR